MFNNVRVLLNLRKNMIVPNCFGQMPHVDPTAFVSPSAVVMGDVTLGARCFVAPNATIRADEPGSRIIFEAGCNVQDNVVVHSLMGSAVHVGEGTSLAHACIVHGPCILGPRCFIGFGSVVFNAELGEDVVVMHRAVVSNHTVPSGKLVQTSTKVDGQCDVHSLADVPEDTKKFVMAVQLTNEALADRYLRAEAHETDC
jgi:carbonic anhydrase/acetyltransferase-like protein (isoleucine patch superfamily)